MKRLPHHLVSIFFALLVLCLCLQAFASVSAERLPDEDWQHALARQGIFLDDHFLQADSSVKNLPEWTGTFEELQEVFEKVRDELAFPSPHNKNFKRRGPWLYPRDGCYAKAAHTAQSVERLGLVRPGKVFTFGHLRLKTPYDTKGWSFWSYHVGTAYRFNNRVVVLDPGVNYKSIMYLEDWLAMTSKDPSKIRVKFCETFTYIPSQKCVGSRRGYEAGTFVHTRDILRREWNNILDLDMRPEKVLGPEPPWRATPDL
jgi:hypothetical protein